MTTRWRLVLAPMLAGALLGALGSAVRANQHGGHVIPAPPGQGHGDHGTPPGWRFTWPSGDAARGRAVFRKLECYSCHEVRGESFPAPGEAGKVGPELAQMGPLHEPEYFAEAIIHPSAVVERGKGYEASDGTSKMPSYNDAVTVQDVIDLVAFLKSLKPGGRGPAPAGGHGGHQ